MKFTVVFKSYQSLDLSFGLVFAPCPIWIKGDEIVVNINPKDSHYQLGSVKKLIEVESLQSKLLEKKAVVIGHGTGYGCESDLKELIKDLRNEGFEVKYKEF
ncbi:hypothetical protein CPJCM30710_24070 [Clostridium polyendosporum]|uniref:Uncharacterized protein n=1 Tax=Clostridium polyendosporum TaxID=69208 RepID=A0A919S1S3_9CLOT|nr:hypothetical protein [Clostridium polyendosporum]GIM29741.1 hypothetical protein CPJCM30710_24070 [Clostridium polyendosporum]